jgi:hypothetical protein
MGLLYQACHLRYHRWAHSAFSSIVGRQWVYVDMDRVHCTLLSIQDHRRNIYIAKQIVVCK